MEIEVGELVRTSKGYIFKIEHNKMVQGLRFLHAQYGTITKHSFNLIDLIEVGDYVNGKRVSVLKGELNLSDIDDENDFCYTDYSDEYGEWYGFREDEVKTILTHELYEQNCYRVKGE